MKDFSISFIGAGNMGEAMIRGLLQSGVAPGRVTAYDVDAKRLRRVREAHRIRTAKNLLETLSADAVVIAVKPQAIEEVLAGLSQSQRHPLLISIVAGVPVSRFIRRLGDKTRVVRVMPNTPALIGQGVSGFFAGPACNKKDLDLARSVAEALGPAHQVKDEGLMDAVTGLSGSGPAYVFVMIEALADGGVKMGLSREAALSLAANTVAGAARLVMETGEHPSSLKDKVSSPGGTTIAGLAALEEAGFRSAVIKAVEAAARRSRELAGPSDEEGQS